MKIKIKDNILALILTIAAITYVLIISFFL